MDGFEFAAVLSARICHDLVSPVGAVVNGVELMRELGGADSAEELAMVEQSATRAARLLAFYRMAFGRARGEGERLSRAQMRDRIAPVLAGGRVRVDWSGLDGPGVDPGTARLVALMALCGRACLGMTGVLALVLEPDRDLPVQAQIIGDSAALGPQQRAWLGGATAPLPEPRQIEFLLLPAAAAALALRLDVATTPGRVTLTATATRQP